MIQTRSQTHPATKVVVLAGGFGTRLAERTDELPKPMVEVGGRPMLWHILNIYSHYGYNDFLIACGYRGGAIKRYFLGYRQEVGDVVIDYARDSVEYLPRLDVPWRVACIDTGLQTQTAGRLRRLRSFLRDSGAARTFLMTYGDGVTDVDINALLDFHHSHGRLATFTAVPEPKMWGKPRLDGDRVIAFDEKPELHGSRISAGYFAIDIDVLDRIDDDTTSFELDVLPSLAREDQLRAFRHDGFWHPMDTLRDVRNLNESWARGNAPWSVWSHA